VEGTPITRDATEERQSDGAVRSRRYDIGSSGEKAFVGSRGRRAGSSRVAKAT